MDKVIDPGAHVPSPFSPAELEELTIATMAIANLIAEGLELGATPATPLLRVSGTILAALRKRGWELPAAGRRRTWLVREPLADGPRVWARVIAPNAEAAIADTRKVIAHHGDRDPPMLEAVEELEGRAVESHKSAAAFTREGKCGICHAPITHNGTGCTAGCPGDHVDRSAVQTPRSQGRPHVANRQGDRCEACGVVLLGVESVPIELRGCPGAVAPKPLARFLLDTADTPRCQGRALSTDEQCTLAVGHDGPHYIGGSAR